MRVLRSVTLALAPLLVGAAVTLAAEGGVQWTPAGTQILTNKDVGTERWAITFNLDDLSATGNIFFTDNREPGFVFCDLQSTSFDSGVGELDLRYKCQGADRGIGGFSLSDWTLISDQVDLPLSFFVPDAETCDLTGALNGPNADNADSRWQCTGNQGNFDFQIFANGTGISSATGEFEFDAAQEGCRFARLGNDSFLDVEYSPSRDLITVFEIPADVSEVIVSECSRANP